MRKMQNYIVQSKEIFVGLEDSKNTWKVAVRSEDLVIHEASIPADYSALIGYLRNNYPIFFKNAVEGSEAKAGKKEGNYGVCKAKSFKCFLYHEKRKYLSAWRSAERVAHSRNFTGTKRYLWATVKAAGCSRSYH